MGILPGVPEREIGVHNFGRGMFVFALLFASLAQAQSAADWQSPRRLVRLDDVESGGVKAFEDARRAWVADVRAGKSKAGAGLAMAWSGTDGDHTRYLMLSAFTTYAELDGYRDLEGGDDGKGGDAYADASHYVEIWRRIDALTMASAADPGLGESTAGAARVEIITETDPRERADLVATWTAIGKALADQKYPLACVVYENRFVSGQLVRIWFAKDLKALKTAPEIKTLITWAAGDRQARDLTVRVNQLSEIERHYTVERRADLSTTGP